MTVVTRDIYAFLSDGPATSAIPMEMINVNAKQAVVKNNKFVYCSDIDR